MRLHDSLVIDQTDDALVLLDARGLTRDKGFVNGVKVLERELVKQRLDIAENTLSSDLLCNDNSTRQVRCGC